MTIPQMMKAIKTSSKGVASIVSDASVPCSIETVPSTYLLVKTTYVALNPTDWKHVDFTDAPNHTVGCDLCGIIVDIGSNVTKPFVVGERVAGFSHGVKIGHPVMGAFAEYALLKGDITLRVPASISDAEACTMGIGITTVGQGLYQALRLPFPDDHGDDKGKFGTLLIYGGSTATGLFAIQLAKLSGLKVLATCSPRNFATVKGFGADAVFDYADPTAFSTPASAQICADALSTGRERGKIPSYAALAPLEFPRNDVNVKYTMAYTVIGESFDSWRGMTMPASAEDFEFGRRLWEVTERLLHENKVRLFPSEQSGGFEGILSGLESLRRNKVSGSKLVYRIG